jgi:site-specific recombinase XerD
MPPRLFELDGQWISRESGSPKLYRYWYDTSSGRVRRRSLGCEDLEQAKRKLAEIVVQGAAVQTERDPAAVLLVSVLDHYLKHKVPGHANPYNAERACQLLAQYLFEHRQMKPTFKVDGFTLALQQDFMEWCAGEHGHKASAIERNMVAIRAAFNFAASSQMITADGQRREARLLTHAPTVKTNQRWIAKHTTARQGGPRDWIPDYEMLADLLDQPAPDYLQRYDIIALNTWARPAAIWDINTTTQLDQDTGLLDLNPPGRKQNNKHRPVIRVTPGLMQWFKVWDRAYPLRGRSRTFTGCKAASAVQTAFERRTDLWRMQKAGYSEADYRDMLSRARRTELDREARWAPYREALAEADALGYRQISQYTLRHFMATKVRALEEVRVDREQRQWWMGHSSGDTTSWYESHDPEFLREAALATEVVIARLDELTQRTLIPASVKQRGLRVVGGNSA